LVRKLKWPPLETNENFEIKIGVFFLLEIQGWNSLGKVLAEAGFCFLGRYFSSIGSYIYCIYSLISDQK
jgi:hypothetical protein